MILQHSSKINICNRLYKGTTILQTNKILQKKNFIKLNIKTIIMFTKTEFREYTTIKLV